MGKDFDVARMRDLNQQYSDRIALAVHSILRDESATIGDVRPELHVLAVTLAQQAGSMAATICNMFDDTDLGRATLAGILARELMRCAQMPVPDKAREEAFDFRKLMKEKL